MSDYSFMKTGFDLTGDNELEDNKNIVALVTLFGENAIRTSYTYVKHAKRNGITVEDLKRCIMLECFFFMKRPDVLQKTEEIKEQLFNTAEEEEPDSDPDEASELDEGDMQVFKSSECTCALCNCVNNIYTRWSNWTPQGPMEEILKDVVDKFGQPILAE